jgi:hypothetical protein
MVVHTDGPHFQHWRDSGALISRNLELNTELQMGTLNITIWTSAGSVTSINDGESSMILPLHNVQ